MDYSFGHPDLACLGEATLVFGDPASTVEFVVRYVGMDPRDSGKDITPEESAALEAAGLGRVIVYQPRKAFVPTWDDNGADAASTALWQATAAGMPEGRPVYFAIDGDSRAFTADQWSAIDAFFAGVHEVLGAERTGVYGGKHTIDRMWALGHAHWLWQTYAWSAGEWAEVHLRQYDNNNTLCGGEVDFDQSMTEDYGQW